MTNRDVTDRRVAVVLPAFGSKVPARVRGYVHELARWQDANGLARVSRRQLATGLGCSERTVQRWHREAERLGLVARTDGGHRGRMQTVRLLCVNPETPAERQARRKAFAAHARARRIRQANMDRARRHADALARARDERRHAALLARCDALDATHLWPAQKGDTGGPLHSHGEAGATNATPRPDGPMATPAETLTDSTPDPDVMAFREAMRVRGRAARKRAKW